MSFAALAYGTAEHADARVSVDTDSIAHAARIRVCDVAFLGGNAAISGWPFTDAQPRDADASARVLQQYRESLALKRRCEQNAAAQFLVYARNSLRGCDAFS
jgi:hypothetical protein